MCNEMAIVELAKEQKGAVAIIFQSLDGFNFNQSKEILDEVTERIKAIPLATKEFQSKIDKIIEEDAVVKPFKQ